MEEWEECADEEGRTFFVNKTTGESVWEIPEKVFALTSVAMDMREIPPVDEATKTLKRTHSFVMDPLIQSRLVRIRSILVMSEESSMADNMTDEEWVHSFDPIGKQDYFYDCVHGYMTTQPPPSYRNDDPLMTWLLVLQCAFRCAIARDKVAKKRKQLASEQVPMMSFTMATKYINRISLDKESEAQRETDERRGMMHNEKAQCANGDRYWGIDQAVREIRRQAMEEELMREAETLRRNLIETARKREEMQRRAAEEQERKRKNEDTALESRERNAMQVQELLQCKTDTFWGVQKQENDEKCAQQQMTIEDAESHKYMQDLLAAQLHARWAMEAARAHKDEIAHKLQQENKYRKQYMKLFKRATTSEDITSYRWPTQIVPDLPKKAHKSNNFQYKLEVVLDPMRRSNPKHIFHSASGTHTVGRKGKLEVSQPESCYHLDEPQIKRHSVVKMPPSKMDPHVPASKNGLPFTVDNVKMTQKRLTKTPSRKSRLNPIQTTETNNEAPSTSPMDDAFEHEEDTLARVFALIDTDHGGTLNKDEMLWALTKDSYVRTVAMESIVLKDVLKKRSVDVLFADMDRDGTHEISWESFRDFCHGIFNEMMAAKEQKLLEKGEPEADLSKENILRRKNEAYATKKAILEQEEAIAKIVFGLVDVDRSGKIDQQEMMHALDSNDRVREFVLRSKGLRPLLENPTFGKAFIGMSTDDSDGMSLDEFLAFCTEIASVAMLNDLVAP